MPYPEHNNLASGANPGHCTSNIEPDIVESSHSVLDLVSSDEINLLDLFLVLAKRWKMIIGVPFVAAVITAIITLFMPNVYTAKTMIIPSDDDSGSMGALMSQLGGLAALAGGSIGGKTSGDLYVTMLKSETIKDPIIDKFKLTERYDEKFKESVYKILDEKIAAISIGKKDGVITIEVNEKDPKLAADMANEYVNQLEKIASKMKMTGAGENRIFLEKRLATARADLAKAEDAIKAFQTKNKAISVTDQAMATIQGVAQLRAQLAVQEVQLGTLKRQFTDRSQEIKTTNATIDNLKAQIGSLEGKGAVSSSIPTVGSMPQLGQEYLRLMREFKIQEAVLEMLTKQYEMAKFSEAKDTSPFQLLVKAKTPELKSKPKRALIIIETLLATGFFMVLIAFILQFIEGLSPEDQNRWNKIKEQLPLVTTFAQKLQIVVGKPKQEKTIHNDSAYGKHE